MPALTTTTPGAVAQLELRMRVWSPNLLAEMQVCGTSYAKGVELVDLEAGSAEPVEAMLSQDGRHWLATWHEGPTADDAVYVERVTADGLDFHGWVDADSRRLVQVG